MKAKSLGCVLMLPLIVLILFTPTTIFMFPNGDIYHFPDCCVMQARVVENPVVLEVLIRWLVSVDWLGQMTDVVKLTMLLVALGMALIGCAAFLSESKPAADSAEDKEA